MNEKIRSISNIGLIAGRLCLDFTNTIDWRGTDNQFELLNNYQDLIIWSRRMEILSERTSGLLFELADKLKSKSDAVYKRAIALREALYRIFLHIIKAKPPDYADWEIFNQELAAVMAKSKIMPIETGFKWDWADHGDDLDRMFGPLVHDAAILLTSDLLSRVGICSDEKCAWLFLDTSKNHKRRWCSMEDCGNRAKFKRHYRRKQSIIPAVIPGEKP